MKRAIVLGASSGLGREVARLLAADGWRLAIAARRIELLDELREVIGGDVMTARIDVNSNNAEADLLSLIDRLGGVNLYFHSSGTGKRNCCLEPDTELLTVETNCLGFTRMVGCAYRYMATHGGGHIAVISSIAGTKGMGAAPSYSASKAFQNKYIEALSQLSTTRNLNISFTDIRPGFVATPLLGGAPYPMLMNAENVAREIVRSVNSKRTVRVIDWRWRIITALWSLIPSCIWRRVNVGCK